MITRDEALEYLLDTTCSACGGELPGPGQPCSGCGRIPPVTAAEIADDLDGPVALAAVEQAKLRAEAWVLHDQAIERMRQADEAAFLARLHVQKDRAQQALDEHQRLHKKLTAPRTAARKAEEAAAAELAAASAEHSEIARAEELARRMRHGVQAETEAAIRLDRATAVLGRYQDAMREAAARRQAAEIAFDTSAERAAVLERARDQAVAALASPGRVPMSAETVTVGGLRLVYSGAMDEVELAIAGIEARQVCAMTGQTDEIEAEIRRRIAAEEEDEHKRKAVHVVSDRGGNMTALPNPRYPRTPQPFHPPAPGNQPNGFNPPVVGGFGP